MCLGAFFLKAFGELFVGAASTKTYTVGGGGCFFFLAGARLLVFTRYFPELRDFYYISVV